MVTIFRYSAHFDPMTNIFIQHTSRPQEDDLLLKQHEICQNFSLRMTNLAAILILDQIPGLCQKIESFNDHYRIFESRLGDFQPLKRTILQLIIQLTGKSSFFEFPARLEAESFVGTSFQFRLNTHTYENLEQFHRHVCQ